MLTSIRERAEGWIAWTIIGLVIIVFAVWGIQSFFTPNPNVTVLKVGDTEVGLRDFQVEYQRQGDKLRSAVKSSDQQPSDEQVRKQTIDTLVERVSLTNGLRAMGLRIGDAQVAAIIQADNEFQVAGVFVQERYEQEIRNAGFTPAIFEARIRTGELVNQFKTGVQQTALITPSQIDDYLRLQGQRRDISYAVIPANISSAPVSEASLNDYYKSHPELYQVPEQVKISYIELSSSALEEQIPANDEALRSLYNDTKANYHREERRKASHILLTLDEKATPAAVEAAKAQLEGWRKQALSGSTPFAELARLHSQDPGSAVQGGDLGFFARDAMVKPFSDAAFALKEGEISEPVRTQFGLHIIQLTGVEPAHDQSFEEAKPALLKEYRRTQADKIFSDRSDTMSNLAYEHPDSLEAVAKELGLKIQNAGPFSRSGGAGIASDPKVLTAAFSDDVLKRANNSDTLELPGNRLVVLRVADHQAARRQTLAEARTQVELAVRQVQARSQAALAGEALLKELRSGKDPQATIQNAKLEWHNIGWINIAGEAEAAGSTTKDFPKELLEVAFRTPRTSTPAYRGVVTANGDFALVQVMGIKDPDLKALPASAREAARRTLSGLDGEQDLASLTAAIRKKTAVTVYNDKF